MVFEIHVWTGAEWSPHTTMGGANAKNAIARMRKGGAKGILRAIPVETTVNQTIRLERKHDLPKLDHLQTKRHHKDKRTKYRPAERFAIMTPGPKRVKLIDMSKPSRRDIRFK